MFGNETTRRRFAASLIGGAALALRSAHAEDDPRPPALNPRATDGDDVAEPKWDERLTLTVGVDGKDADLYGRDEKVIQAALAQVVRMGGGTVKLLPGKWVLRHPVVLPSGIRLFGSGADTIITKIPSRITPLSGDSDWYDREITLENAQGFKVGDGVVLRATNPHNGGALVIKRTIVGRSGNRFRLDNGLRENLWLTGKPTCSAMFPLLTAERTSNVVIENLTLDGDKDNNEHLDGNYAGCIFLQDCNRFTIRKVVAKRYNGDGISFQIAHDVVVEDCESLDNADLGIHPGSGSQRPLIRRNRISGNTIGLFWCWGVKYGLGERNRISDSKNYGISIGHNDTDNLMRDNDVSNSGKVGILFRDESRGKDFWPNRNRVENNRIVNSGGEKGIAIDIQGKTHDVKIVGNVLSETRGPASRVGLKIGPSTQAITADANRFQGFAKDVVDESKRA